MRILIPIIFIFCIQDIKAQDTLKTVKGDTLVVDHLEKLGNKYKFTLFKKSYLEKYEYDKSEIQSIISRQNKIIYDRRMEYSAQGIDVGNPNIVAGYEDANKNYTGYKDAGKLTFGASLCFPPAGLVTMIICNTTPPSYLNSGIAYDKLNNNDYNKAYMKQTLKIKRKKVLANFIAGSVLFAGIYFVLWQTNPSN
jgi:hypothetical protein